VSTTATVSAAAAYVEEVLAILMSDYYLADDVDWQEFRSRLLRATEDAVSTVDTHFAIRAMLQTLDPHAKFLAPEEADSLSTREPTEPIDVAISDGLFGLIAIPGYFADSQVGFEEWAQQAHGDMAVIAPDVCGWIVDLRENDGGNMWPMLTAVGPLLNGESVGAFTYEEGTPAVWRYRDGATYLDQELMGAVADPFVSEDQSVAILIGQSTVSSGEAIVVAFSGQAEARSFGEETGGFTSAVAGYTLSDGALIGVPTSIFTDRTGFSYPYNTAIPPDQPAPDALSAARDWLRSSDACS
jgi:C-terminal processing protease CtpA/Prc